ncbi:MAG: NAD(P)-binding domain-containing protein, partial [Dehalococcoidales bacterium]|nr:NAD(P)-binding domain-containing protein [Dehalococcoidales bacterium]
MGKNKQKMKSKEVAAMETRIGFIGLGIMGMPMARNLIKAGFEVVVYNRTVSKAEQMVSEGAIKVNSPKELAERTNTIISIVSDTPDVEEVIL